MGMFNKLFGKKTDASTKAPKGFVLVRVKEVVRETPNAVSVAFEISDSDRAKFSFVPGQYVTILLQINGNDERRSYSICSSPDEDLRIGVKKIENGVVSSFINDELKVGDEVWLSVPEGRFNLTHPQGNFVAFAAGSGITPILSIAKSIAKENGSLKLFFGNKYANQIMFRSTLEELGDTISTTYFLSAESKEGFEAGRLNQEKIAELIKADLSLLRADAFYICGPEEMIMSAIETLKVFGVSEDKIIYELFTTPVFMKSNQKIADSASFEGVAKVEVELDGELINFELDTKGATILDKLTQLGEDAPYSCKGGVCCTCRAKVTEGKATMKMNYSLTDKEVEQGYVLTCQAHPSSDVLKLTYDD